MWIDIPPPLRIVVHHNICKYYTIIEFKFNPSITVVIATQCQYRGALYIDYTPERSPICFLFMYTTKFLNSNVSIFNLDLLSSSKIYTIVDFCVNIIEL